MSIATEISRLQTAKADIKTAIENKGVTVPASATLDTYATLINSISGGSIGLEYEEGVYEPTSDIARPTINFANSHTEAPIFVSIYDATGTIDTTSNSNIGMNYIDPYKLWGVGYPYSSSAYRYETIQYIYRGTSANSINTGTMHCTYNSDYNSSSSTSTAKYWVDNTSFRPYSSSTSRYWRTGRTYKWIAIWK